MHFVNKLVKVVLVPSTKIDESLNGLIRVCGNILSLTGFDDADRVVDKESEVGDAIINIGGLVDAHERFVEDSEEVAEKLECSGLIITLY